ncbi:hypothetical protein J437_LFUL011808 [Ladona fulva]|uniref:G-protein coupled receptors family 1 profile domain-containing protein n=1 Tax=Ladona fulva TaxID=123851 RepID=A0A8K0KBS7_LADFU|nr:hypothetical protein J437_LFUL011808 [Ladona fulva]
MAPATDFSEFQTNSTIGGDKVDSILGRESPLDAAAIESLLKNLSLLHTHHIHHHHHHQHSGLGMLQGVGGSTSLRHRGPVELPEILWPDVKQFLINGSLGINFSSPTTILTFPENGEFKPDGGVSVGPQDECDPLLDVLDFFHLYYIPFIILVGLVGNLLSCVVFLNTHLRLRSSSYYLAALATADLGFLATLFLVWLNNNAGVVVFNRDGWCQGLVYVSSVCR